MSEFQDLANELVSLKGRRMDNALTRLEAAIGQLAADIERLFGEEARPQLTLVGEDGEEA